jgi:transcriptional regulator with XRE-family HTH domain
LSAGNQDNSYSQEEIGLRVRAIRKEAGLTLADVAAATSLSQGFLSQVENGLTAMSLASLYLISDALGIPATRILTADTYPAVSIVRGDEGAWYENVPGEPAMTRDLTATKRRHLDARESELPADWVGPTLTHPGEEFIHVISGAMNLELVGSLTEVLEAGDTIVFPAQVPHRWMSAGSEARLISVVANPNAADIDYEPMLLTQQRSVTP